MACLSFLMPSATIQDVALRIPEGQIGNRTTMIPNITPAVTLE
jgi:hypothetical protein